MNIHISTLKRTRPQPSSSPPRRERARGLYSCTDSSSKPCCGWCVLWVGVALWVACKYTYIYICVWLVGCVRVYIFAGLSLSLPLSQNTFHSNPLTPPPPKTHTHNQRTHSSRGGDQQPVRHRPVHHRLPQRRGRLCWCWCWCPLLLLLLLFLARSI